MGKGRREHEKNTEKEGRKEIKLGRKSRKGKKGEKETRGKEKEGRKEGRKGN